MAEGPETIEQSARRIGRHAWLEMRLFEVLGRWSGTVPDPRARAAFATHSRQHAWHAELWHGLLPAVPHLGAAELVAPDEAAAAIVAGLDALDAGGEGASAAGDEGGSGDDSAGDGPGTDTSVADAPSLDTTAALTAVYREALPHLVRAYTDHLAVTTPVTDAPTIRVLRLVLGDLDDERASGDALIEAQASRAGA
jgi:hypothetical protein